MLATPELIREAAQAGRVAAMLPRWRELPLYQEALAGSPADLAVLPVLTKREMRSDFPRNFLPATRALEDLLARQVVELEHTSGTSEDRLPVIFARGWWNEQEERALRLNSLVSRVLDEHPQARRATLTAPACNGLTCPTVWMSQSQRTLGNALFVNLARIPFLLDEAELQRMADEILHWSPQFLDLDPVHGAWFALFCERRHLRFPSLRFIICSYEFVSVVHRRILDRVFGVPVFNLYGSTETGHLLMENQAGEMKPSYDTAWLEVVAEGENPVAATSVQDADGLPVATGRPMVSRSELPRLGHESPGAHSRDRSACPDADAIGALLVTTLSNDYMPLLRYRIGDLAQRHERPYGTDYTVHGRIRDALASTHGDRVTTWQVDQCFAGVEGIVHYQLRQQSPDDFHLRYIPEPAGVSQHALSGLVARLRVLLGAGVGLESVPTLLPEASGKFRLTAQITTSAAPGGFLAK